MLDILFYVFVYVDFWNFNHKRCLNGILTTKLIEAICAMGILPDTYNCGMLMRQECLTEG